MTGYLFDTSVLSAFAPGRPPLSPELSQWLLALGDREEAFLSTIVILEAQRGFAKLRRQGGGVRAGMLEQWLDEVLRQFDDRILPVTTQIARLAGTLEDDMIARGRNPGLADILIAATATSHGLTVLTANVRHFSSLGVPHINPFADHRERF